ncbi:MAG: MBL fold metallo-hydrolase, partial [Phycisphaerales bacterium]|nr:MBL fold metallo-hydrolase [Phycisphaerales bacterium]
MRLTFWGAAQTVTGSMHHLETGGKRFLLDCGLYQGRRKEAQERNRILPFPAQSIDAVILSHAHIDHSGNLPSLVKSGYTGPIYTTPATIDLCEAMLKDTAHIQEKDAEFVNKRLSRRNHRENGEEPVQPLYSMEDAERTLPLFKAVNYHQQKLADGGLRYTPYEAGHMLGSTALHLDDGTTKLIFSGDIGRHRLPIIRDPEPLPRADYLI